MNARGAVLTGIGIGIAPISASLFLSRKVINTNPLAVHETIEPPAEKMSGQSDAP